MVWTDGYYYNRDDISQKLDQNTLEFLNNYIIENKVIKINSKDKIILLDVNQLKKKWNGGKCYSCHKGLGCCFGSPYPFSDNDAKKFSKYEKQIFDIVLDDYAKQNKTLELETESILEENTLISILDDDKVKCIMLTKNGCAIKRYCIDNGIKLLDIYNLSCMLFPMDIIVLTKGQTVAYFITSYIDNVSLWKHIGRWDSFYEETKCKCFSNGIPIYKENKSLLMNEFGSVIYKKMKEVLDD